MKKIECEGMAAGEFIKKVEEAVKGRALGDIVSFQVKPTAITVVFSKLGKTELVYDVKTVGSGFCATLASEKLAFAHRPFKADMEEKLCGVMRKVGAKVS